MYIAIDIGGTKTIVSGFKDIDIHTQEFSHMFKTDLDYASHLESIISVIQANGHLGEIEGIGLSHVGIVDKEKGMCLFSANLPEYENKPIVDELMNRFNVPVKIENDLVCAGLAEARFGYGRSYDRVFYFTVSTGIGGAYVYKLDGEYHVEQVEAGHFVIKGMGLGGPGMQLDIIESYVGGRSMEQRFLKKPEEIKDLLLWEQQIQYLATSVINSLVMFNPEILVFGGGMIEQNEYLREKLIIEVGKGLKTRSLPNIKISGFGKQVVVYGALSLLLD